MTDNRGSDDQRERSRSNRGIDAPVRSRSPRRSQHSPDKGSRQHHHKPRPETHRRPHSRDRSRDRHRRQPAEQAHGPAQPDDLIPRFRESQARQAEQDAAHSQRSRSRGRDRNRSPSSSRRHRSRSRSPGSSHRKRSHRERTPTRKSRDNEHEASSKKRRRHSPHHRRPESPRRHSRPHRSPTSSRADPTRPRRDSVARSPHRSDRESRRGSWDSRQADQDGHGQTSRSRTPASERRGSLPRRQGSVPHEGHPSRHDEPPKPSHSRGSDNLASRPPRGAEREHLHREGSTDHPLSSRSDFEDDMGARSTHREGDRGSHSRAFHDSRGYSNSPHHRKSPSPSRGQGREPWNGSRSPHHHYENGSHVPHGGASPPFAPPSGPSSRGGPRAGFRSGAFPGRGGPRGSGSQWNSNSGHFSRGNSSRGEDDWRRGSGNGDDRVTEPMDIDRHPTDDGHSVERTERAQEPPKGPSAQSGSSKFSFAFKPSSKPAPAGPKPEIEQKFNAPAKKPETPQKPPTPQKDTSREPPRGAPTQPAAQAFDTRKAPDGPRMAPRMRKVKKIMKKLKPRPTLPTELVASESVFFRKPGNESVVGSGTYGKVFKGLNVYTKDQVALKRIRMEGERDGFPVTAIREIKLLQSLRHRNIVNLQEVMVEKNDCFMVFEYLSHDLTGLLNHPSFKLEPSQKKHLAKQLFEGLDYLHTRGVLHRDIKAANVLVSSDGIIKLADFGLARFYAKRHQLDYTNRVITIWYRSPELLLGETKYTAAVDIWSAACIMVEIFAKNAIFAGDGTELSQIDKIYNILGTPNRHDWPGLVDMAWFELLRPTVKKKSTFAEKYSDKVTPAAFDLLQSMFEYNPAKRPTAAEVLKHPYFTTEEPLAQQAVELANIGGDWHEFESKALRKENERRDREARRAAKGGTPVAAAPARDKEQQQRKRAPEDDDAQRDIKRVNVGEASAAGAQ